MIKINKKEIIKQCSVETGYSQKTILEIYDNIWKKYKAVILSEKTLTISGFGSIQIVNRKSKCHKHPTTGEYIWGQEYKTLLLSPTPSFMKTINNN